MVKNNKINIDNFKPILKQKHKQHRKRKLNNKQTGNRNLKKGK